MIEKQITIIIPVYQVKDYLEECLKSVLKQSYLNLEIITVDDGSSDGSAEICDRYAKMDSRVKVIHKENGGLSSARNVGIENASGEYLVFLDADDWIAPNFVERLLDVALAHDCDIVQCSHQDVFDGCFVHEDRAQKVAKPQIFTGREFSYAIYNLIEWPANIATNKLYKRCLFTNIRFPEGRLHEDEFTTYRAIWKAEKIGLISDKLYYYRRRGGSITQQSYSKRRLDASVAYFERASFYAKQGEPELEYMTDDCHLKWIESQITCVQELDVAEKNDILDELERNRIRLLGKLQGQNSKTHVDDIMFPVGKVDRNSNVVLYGAGLLGQRYFKQVYAQNYCNIVLWADQNVEGCRRLGFPVQSISKLKDSFVKYDYVVIAIRNFEVVKEVVKLLREEYGVPAEKIIF